MAKTGSKAAGKTAGQDDGTVKNFEERLERLETLGEQIRRTDIPLDQALKAFEEGIRLARALEKDLGKVDSRIEILMNGVDDPDDSLDDDPSGDASGDGRAVGRSSAAKSSPMLELFEAED